MIEGGFPILEKYNAKDDLMQPPKQIKRQAAPTFNEMQKRIEKLSAKEMEKLLPKNLDNYNDVVKALVSPQKTKGTRKKQTKMVFVKPLEKVPPQMTSDR